MSAIRLNIRAALTQWDGLQDTRVLVEGVPEGAYLSAGRCNADGNWELGAADLDRLWITPPPGSDQDIELEVHSITSEVFDGSSCVESLEVVYLRVSISLDFTHPGESPFDDPRPALYMPS